METFTYSDSQETLITHTVANGLRLLLVAKPAFHETYALLTVNYGAVDTHYQPALDSSRVQDPAGIAHFLEHKLFEKEDHDAFDLFGATGASANAFTSATRTAYLFSSATHVETNLTTLLDFVQTPYFTAETVAKEQGIIGQEIQMYQDDPNWRLYMALLNALYPGQPQAQDVAGSVASIAQITPELLMRAYDAFYQPGNMTLTVVGHFDPPAVIDLVTANQRQKGQLARPTPVRLDAFDGNLATIKPFQRLQFPTARPKSIIGIKGTEDIADDEPGIKVQIARRLALELLFGDASPLYQQWYDTGLVDDSFDYDDVSQRGANYVTISGETETPQAFSDAVIQALKAFNTRLEVNEANFERLQHAALGKYYQSSNGLSGLANALSAQSFGPLNPFDYGRLLQQVTLKDVRQAAETMFQEAAMAVVQLLPEEA